MKTLNRTKAGRLNEAESRFLHNLIQRGIRDIKEQIPHLPAIKDGAKSELKKTVIFGNKIAKDIVYNRITIFIKPA